MNPAIYSDRPLPALPLFSLFQGNMAQILINNETKGLSQNYICKSNKLNNEVRK